MPTGPPGRAVPNPRSRSGGRRARDLMLAVRAPAAYRRVSAAVMRLPLRSRLRRAFVDRAIGQQYAAFHRRDFDVLLATHHRDVEIRMARPEGSPLGAGLEDVYRGHDGLRRLWSTWLEPWEDFNFRPVRVVDVDAERILVLCRMEARGRASGLELSQPIAQLFTIRGGSVARQDNYWSWEEGLRTAGIDSYN